MAIATFCVDGVHRTVPDPPTEAPDVPYDHGPCKDCAWSWPCLTWDGWQVEVRDSKTQRLMETPVICTCGAYDPSVIEGEDACDLCDCFERRGKDVQKG